MARAGAFDGVDAAMMVHPAGVDLARMDVIAVQELTATYTGEAAHAAAFPHQGRNALDAAVLGYLNVAALRQHIRPDERIHGIFTEAGDKPNIVPGPGRRPSGWCARRSISHASAPLKARVAACLEAGADGRRLRDGASRGSRSSTPTCSTTRRWSTSTPPTARRSGRTVAEPDAEAGRGRAAPTWATSATWCRRSTR